MLKPIAHEALQHATSVVVFFVLANSAKYDMLLVRLLDVIPNCAKSLLYLRLQDDCSRHPHYASANNDSPQTSTCTSYNCATHEHYKMENVDRPKIKTVNNFSS
jgi:hypothetical protein